METLGLILLIIILVTLILSIVYGIRLWKKKGEKGSEEYINIKRKLTISLIVLVISFICLFISSIEALFSLLFLIALGTTIFYGIKWWNNRDNKESKIYKAGKRNTLTSILVLVIAVIGVGVIENQIEEQQAEEARKEYKTDKKKFTSQYKELGYMTESLSSSEGDDWEDAIDQDPEGFDIDKTITNIQDDHSDDIDSVSESLDKLHKIDQEIQNNDYAPEKARKKIHNSYLTMKHFADHATSISGSYNDFTDEHNKLDRQTSDRLEELEDL